MAKNEKQLVKIIKEICLDENIKFESFSDDWIMQLTNKEGQKALIYSYKFPNNNAAVSKVCDDKSALSDVLKSNNIPCVEHLYFEGPKSPMFEHTSLLNELSTLLDKYNELVLKANFGSGGNKVYRCSNIKEVEAAAFELLKHNRSMSVSPYVKIMNEYRVIILEDKAMLIYSKKRPFVIGDGISSIRELIKENGISKVDIEHSLDLEYVPKEKEEVVVSWKHNLGKGSLPIIISDEKLKEKLSNFALKIAKILNLKFAAIDIICDDNNEYKVLEINSGIMMEVFSSLNEENYQTAKHIYRNALIEYFKKIKE